MTRYSGINRYNKTRTFQLGEGVYEIDIIWILFFMAGVIAAVLTLTTLQTEQGLLFDISMLQLIMGLAGIALVLFLAPIIKLQLIPDWESVKGWITYGILGFIIARFALVILGLIQNLSSAIQYNNLTIVLTSAVFEEALFLPIAAILFYVFKETFEQMVAPLVGKDIAHALAIISTALFTGVIFAALHIGVYGTDYGIMLSLTAARFVYTVIFLISRNFMASTFAHMFHNFSVWLMWM